MKSVILLTAVLALAGCATALEPKLSLKPATGFDLVDPSRVDQVAYSADYAQCATLANQDKVDIEASAGAVLSTAADRASFGLLGNKPSKHADRVSVLKRCLTGRGYAVIR